MATAFQKVYTKISQITKATCSLKAKGVGYNVPPMTPESSPTVADV